MTRACRLLGAIALAVTSLVLFGTSGTPAYACSCAVSTTEQYVDNAEAVFTGTVTDRAQEGGRLAAVVYTVAVDQIYAGQVGSEVRLSTAAHSASCGLPGLPAGEPLLFFGSRQLSLGPSGPDDEAAAAADYGINLCNGTGSTDDAELAEVEAVTGAPREPSGAAESGPAETSGTGAQSGDDGAADDGSADDGISPWLVGGIGVGALALAVLGGVLLRRRQA